MADERKPETPFVRRRDLRAQREAEERRAAGAPAPAVPSAPPVDALTAPIEQLGGASGTTAPSDPARPLVAPARPADAPTMADAPAILAGAPTLPADAPAGTPAVWPPAPLPGDPAPGASAAAGASGAAQASVATPTGPVTGGLRRRDLRAQSVPMSFGSGEGAIPSGESTAPGSAVAEPAGGLLTAPEPPAPAETDPESAPAPAPAAAQTLAGDAGPETAALPEAPSGILVDQDPEPVEAAHPRTRRELAEIPEPKDYGRAGRNLPAAIGVGLAVGLSILAVLIFYPPAFIGIAILGIVGALWELSSALSRSGAQVARIPTMTAGACMALATAFAGREALWVAFAIGAGAILLWTLFERRPNAVKDVSLGIFALTYVGLMASFIVHMITLDRGNLLVITFLAVVIASDVGGYAFGVLWGKHPIAPRISPKKSWEGFAGSVIVGSGIGVTLSVLVVDAPWWCGIVLGLVIPAVATLGDFSESMIKRDLDLKDMGTLLPGHGGVMDRLDSILPTAPVALALFTVLPGFIS